MVQQTIIATREQLYAFLNNPDPTLVYGLIVFPININFDFISNYKKVLNVSTSNTQITASVFY